MNSNNWLSFPLSPTHSSIPPHLQGAQSHQFSLGLVNDNIDSPFPAQGKSLESPCFFFLLKIQDIVCERKGINPTDYESNLQSGI